jgi:hypothetical protein
MTRRTQGLQVSAVPEERRIVVMGLDVVDVELVLHVATVGTGIRLVLEDLVTQAGPAQGAVPAPGSGVGTDRMRRAAPTGNEDPTTWLCAVLHRALQY